jgi:hypothetical protein
MPTKASDVRSCSTSGENQGAPDWSEYQSDVRKHSMPVEDVMSNSLNLTASRFATDSCEMKIVFAIGAVYGLTRIR